MLHWVESFPLLFRPQSVWEAGFPVTTTVRHPEELARCVSRHAWVTGGETTGNDLDKYSPFFHVPGLKSHSISNLHFSPPQKYTKVVNMLS